MAPARRGVSLIEVMIAVVVIAAALIPFLGSGTAVHRRTYFYEHHVMAAIRARTILDLVRSVDFDLLDHYARSRGGGGPVEIDVEKLLEPGGFRLLLDSEAAGPTAQAYDAKLENFTHRVEYVRKSGDLGEIRVRVDWSNPSQRDRKPHTIELVRLVNRPEASTTAP